MNTYQIIFILVLLLISPCLSVYFYSNPTSVDNWSFIPCLLSLAITIFELIVLVIFGCAWFYKFLGTM